MGYFLYILRSEAAGKHYVGISSHPERRLEFHNTVERGFTSRYRPWRLVYTKGFSTKAEAAQAERMVKRRKSRGFIMELIDGKTTL
jgi:putative endonuclease